MTKHKFKKGDEVLSAKGETWKVLKVSISSVTGEPTLTLAKYYKGTKTKQVSGVPEKGLKKK